MINDIKFYRKDDILSDINRCKIGYNAPGAMLACSNLCGHFNPVRYDKMYEGELDKLYAFEGFLQVRIRKAKDAQRKLKAENELKAKKAERILDDGGQMGNTVKQTNSINDFNREFKTVLANEIPYKFKYDTSISYRVSFDDFLFTPGLENTFNLLDYKTIVAKDGINYTDYSESDISREAAMKAFEKMTTNTSNGPIDFDSYLKK